MGEALRDAGPLPERRGYLLNESTGSRDYYVLRGGVLRIRHSPRSPDSDSVFLAHGSTVALQANNIIEISSRMVPYAQEYQLVATSEAEAEGWHDAISASIRSEQAKMERLLALMEEGTTMHKYNYSNSKRSRRYFWVADEGRQLCWGRSKGEDTQSVNLRECIGIIYGPMTTTFQRCQNLEDASWQCFSLLFMGRTLDLTVSCDLQVHAWFLGMQHLISIHGIGSMPMMSDAQFLARKVQYKLMAVAHRNGLVLGRYLLERVRALASGRGLTSPTPGAPSSSRATQGSAGGDPAPAGGSAPMSARESRRSRKREAEESDASTRVGALRDRVLQMKELLREQSAQAEAIEAVLKRIPGITEQELQVMLRETALQTLRVRCGQLQEEAAEIAETADQLLPQVKATEKTDRSMRKLQQKLEESEARRMALEKELSLALSGAQAPAGIANNISSAAQVAEAAENSRLLEQAEQRVQELERQLQEAQDRERAEAERAKSREREEAKAKERTEKLAERSGALQAALGRLREGQLAVRTEAQTARQSFGGELEELMRGFMRLGEAKKALEARYKGAVEDRKRLHNLVLDLKGNIRVFVRVRPINSKETPQEPQNEATVEYRDEFNIGVYDGQHSRRKWFEFDQVFSPATSQAQVFEEVAPLATSVLDGYNVCVFAYGQTGSGKTHTMTGTAQEPGLNTNVLRQLFKMRDERINEYDISIGIAITEIYNESIRDLLSPSPKKLDVKLMPDGETGVPGLTELTVSNVEEVMKCIGDAAKNRATSVTDMNEQSSRSHSIVTVRTQCKLKGGETYMGKIHLIDLAGSENTNKSGVTGQGMKEAQNINKSLSALGDVIQSLVAKNPHTPFRNSKLTMMLKDSLGGDAKTMMIVCNSPAQSNVTETLSSLNFAARARNVELGKAKRNSVA